MSNIKAFFTKHQGAIVRLLLCAYAAAMCTVVGFADPSSEILGGIGDGLNQIYKLIWGIALGVAVIVFAYNAFKMIISGSRATEEAKTKLITIGVAIALIAFAPMIIRTISGWFASQGGGQVGTFNFSTQ